MESFRREALRRVTTERPKWRGIWEESQNWAQKESHGGES